jgi:Helix-turn-helix domain
MTGRVLTIRDLAKYFGISRKRVCEMLRREAAAGFPCFQAGGGWCVDLDEMREWMCRQVEEKARGDSAEGFASEDPSTKKSFVK